MVIRVDSGRKAKGTKQNLTLNIFIERTAHAQTRKEPTAKRTALLQTLSPKLSILGFLAQLFFLRGVYVIPLATNPKHGEYQND